MPFGFSANWGKPVVCLFLSNLRPFRECPTLPARRARSCGNIDSFRCGQNSTSERLYVPRRVTRIRHEKCISGIESCVKRRRRRSNIKEVVTWKSLCWGHPVPEKVHRQRWSHKSMIFLMYQPVTSSERTSRMEQNWERKQRHLWTLVSWFPMN